MKTSNPSIKIILGILLLVVAVSLIRRAFTGGDALDLFTVLLNDGWIYVGLLVGMIGSTLVIIGLIQVNRSKS